MEVKQSTYGSAAGTTASTGAPVKKSNLKKITGVFKEEKGKGFEVRINAEILAALHGIAEGDYLKVYQNESNSGVQYLSVNVKPMGKALNS